MRIRLIEYGVGVEISELQQCGLLAQEVLNSVEKTNRRLKRCLNCTRDVLIKTEGRLRACGIAGIVRLTSQIELEVVPKFLAHTIDTSWQSTLYLLSVMSKHGTVLTTDHIHSSMSYIDSLYDIAGRMLAQGYQSNKRKLIRKYRKEVFRDFAIDGELDFDAIIERNQDGKKQSQIRFDIFNGYNATIAKAMRITLPYVSDNNIRNILSTAISMFGKQSPAPTNKLNVPSRNKEWSDTYDLAYDIVNGLSNSFDAGKVIAPGYVANTWQLWEWLLTAGMTVGNLQYVVKGQDPIEWGKKVCVGRPISVNVYPDISIRDKSTNQVQYLIDAKYKLLVNPATGEILRDDLYEAFAFCCATNSELLFLAYPTDDHGTDEAGTVHKQAEYWLSGKRIIVITVSFGTLNQRGGLYAFGRNMQKGINDIVNEIHA